MLCSKYCNGITSEINELGSSYVKYTNKVQISDFILEVAKYCFEQNNADK